jgi:hypothetical protein
VVNDSYTHNLEKLATVAGLSAEFDREAALDAKFEVNWGLAKDWSEESRYNVAIAYDDAVGLISAVSHRQHGVLRWLRRHW